MSMNSSLEMQVDYGFGPQLVIMGTILGSIFIGIFTFTITKKINWSDASNNSINLKTENIESSFSPGESTTEEPVVIDQAQCLVSNNFPESILQWCLEISKYSAEYDLSPNLIAAVMLQESGGDPFAYSHSGAVGLMQIMPRDGIASSFMCINGPCFTSRPSIVELQNPEFNIEYGTRMLANLRARYGDIRDALKFYGPMDVGYTYADKVLAIYDNYQ
jgi:hypothetical protein